MVPEREHFSRDELTRVLSHYELDPVEKVREFPRGSHRSPKVILKTAAGRYLLKRRAAGRDRPGRVAFTHALLWHLRQKGFPVPALVLTRDTQDSSLRLDGRVYELYEYAEGEHYSGSLDQTLHAGRTLAKFHRAVRDFETPWRPPGGTYHDADLVRQGLQAVPGSVSSHDSVVGHEAELLTMTQELLERYDAAAAAVRQCGYEQWPATTLHGDWHPGNMLFAGPRVAIVLDFDSARRGPPSLDVANGMLQFSILRGGGEPEEWPEWFDLTRMRRFFEGYRSRVRLDAGQRRAAFPLMTEALIAESVVPIAATGSLGWLPGFGVLQMVCRKVRWLERETPAISAWLLDKESE